MLVLVTSGLADFVQRGLACPPSEHDDNVRGYAKANALMTEMLA